MMRTWLAVASVCLLVLSAGAVGAAEWILQFDNYDADPNGNTNGSGGLTFWYCYLEGEGYTCDFDADTAGSSDGRTLSFVKPDGYSGRALYFGLDAAGSLPISIASQGVTVGARAKPKTLVEGMSLIAIASANDDQTGYLGFGSGNQIGLMTIGGGGARWETSTVPYDDGGYHIFTLAAKNIDAYTVWDVYVDGVAQHQTNPASDLSLHFWVGSLPGNDGLNTTYFGMREWNTGAQDFVLDYVGIRQGYEPGWNPVPEPSSLFALVAGLSGLAGVALRPRR